MILIGIGQEKASVWRIRIGLPERPAPLCVPEVEVEMVDERHFRHQSMCGCARFSWPFRGPLSDWLWPNGHEWAKRQLERAGIRYEALGNGFRSCENPGALQQICQRLGPEAVKSFFWRRVHRLPSRFSAADFRAGYVYALAFQQFEVSETCVFDRPQARRKWFEGVIRDHLDIGRPDEITIIFGRAITRRTPGAFQTRVLTRGVDPAPTHNHRASRGGALYQHAWWVLAPGLGVLDPRLPEANSPLAVGWHRFEAALDDFIEGNLVAA